MNVTDMTPPTVCIVRGDCWVEADELRHHHEQTVEDVLDEIVDKANSIGCAYANNDISGEEMMGALQEIVAEYAAKLRLAGDAK